MLTVLQALWLPGSQTEVAVVTADFVKVYNLSVDAISPHYYFLLPTGKIRDATFVVSDSERHLVLMASSGYIYTQAMDATSSAQHGPFYITNILEMKHADVKVEYTLPFAPVVFSSALILIVQWPEWLLDPSVLDISELWQIIIVLFLVYQTVGTGRSYLSWFIGNAGL